MKAAGGMGASARRTQTCRGRRPSPGNPCLLNKPRPDSFLVAWMDEENKNHIDAKRLVLQVASWLNEEGRHGNSESRAHCVRRDNKQHLICSFAVTLPLEAAAQLDFRLWQLDFHLNHVNLCIVSAVEQIQVMASKRQYKEAAAQMEAVNQLCSHFEA